MKPVFFAPGEEMRAWLEAHHASEAELWAGIYKKGSDKAGVTLREAQDHGLMHEAGLRAFERRRA